MKLQRMIEVQTFTYNEQQYMLAKFPEAFWFEYQDHVRFYLPESKIIQVTEALNEYKEKEN